MTRDTPNATEKGAKTRNLSKNEEREKNTRDMALTLRKLKINEAIDGLTGPICPGSFRKILKVVLGTAEQQILGYGGNSQVGTGWNS